MDPRALFESTDTKWLERPDSHVENNWVERKEWVTSGRLAEQISAFANGQPPGGLIVIGVTGDGKIVGLNAKAPDKLVEELANHVDGQRPRDWDYKWLSVDGGKDRILFVYVPFSDTRVVCLADGTAFRRTGASTVKLTPDEIRELRDARGERRVELSPIAPFTEALLDAEIAQSFLDGVIARNNLSLPIDLRKALENKKLLTTTPAGPTMTLAGVVALARTPTDFVPGARLRFLRFEGTTEELGTERNVTKDLWFDGPLPKIVQEFRAFMRTQVREFEHLGTDGKIVRRPEYPEVAWQEAVVNALVHRSYTIQSAATFVRMFDDRIEVESPGGYPGANRPDAEGLFPHSAPRNPTLAGALQYLGLVWLAQEGTRRMHNAMKDMGLPVPEYRDARGAKVVVTLKNDDLARRRARANTGDIAKEWEEVEQGLKESLAYFQNLAIQKWTTLASRGLVPPQSLVAAAEALLRDPSIVAQVKRDAVRLFDRLPLDVLRDPAVRMVNDAFRGLFTDAPDVLQWVPILANRVDEAVELALQNLEARDPLSPPPGDPRIANMLIVLFTRLNREPPPSRQWVGRALAVAKRGGSPVAQQLYTAITGKGLGG